MRGHSHFAQMLTYTEEVNAQDYTFNAPVHKESVFVRARRRLRYTLRGPPTVSAFEPINRMTGAALLLEYVENGNLLKIHYNQKYHNINLPNRLLWRLYLCCKISLISPPFSPLSFSSEQLREKTYNSALMLIDP